MAEAGMTNRPGIAYIISNSYDSSAQLGKLEGAHKDAEKMIEVFTQLRYEVVARRNLTRDGLIRFISEAASRAYAPSYKRLVFTFSGHGAVGETLYDRFGTPRGNASGKLCSQEGSEIEIESIIEQFKPDKHPALGRMARLFFFDVCRGTEEDRGVPLQARSQMDDGQMSERGGEFLLPDDRVPKDGNILVAYSTLPNHKAYELRSGSLWIKFLTEAILNQNDEISVILTDVRSRFLQEFKLRCYPVLQTPQCINQLTGRVNFLGELLTAIGQDGSSALPSASAKPSTTTTAQPCLPPQNRTPVSSPSVPKTPVTKLQEYCQQNNTALPAYKELQVPVGFRYTVTVRDREYTGEIKGNKQDARHSAAEVAFQQLDNSRFTNRGASSVSSVKDLKEKYFDKNRITFKKDSYFSTIGIDGGYQCTLRIGGNVFTSETCQSKSDAENGAAKKALIHFKL